MAKKTTKPADKRYHQAYKSESLYRKHKEARLVRHILSHPNDQQSMDAAKNISPNPTRKIPKSRQWDSMKKFMAQWFKKIRGTEKAAEFQKKKKPVHVNVSNGIVIS